MKNPEIEAMLDTERWRVEMFYEDLVTGPAICTHCADYQIRQILSVADPNDLGPGWELLKQIRITLACESQQENDND